MKSKLIRSFVGVVAALALLAGAAAADDVTASGTANYRIKKVKVTGFEHQVQLLAWAGVGDSSVVFALDTEKPLRSTAPDIVTFRSFTLNSRGKVGTSNDLLMMDGGRVCQAAAFWFDDQSTPSTAHGLLLIAYYPEGLDDERSVGRFAAASFDASGELTTDFETLLEISAPEDMVFQDLWLSAGVRGDVVGVFAGADILEMDYDDLWGSRASEAYFMELSSTGVLRTPGVADVRLPRDGDFRLFRPYGPAWNGESWMVPGVVTLLKRVPWERPDWVDEIGYQIHVLRVTPNQAGDSFDMEMHKIASDRTNVPWPTYVSLVFLPYLPHTPMTESPVQEGEPLNLLYTHAAPANGPLVGPHSKRYTYFYQHISAEGERIGERSKFNATPWFRPYLGTPNRKSRETFSFFSNYLVLTYCGCALLTHSRSAYYTELSGGSRTWQELQLDCYSFNLSTGQVNSLAGANYKGKVWSGGPLIRPFGYPYPYLLRSLSLFRREGGNGQYHSFYFSKLPVY